MIKLGINDKFSGLVNKTILIAYFNLCQAVAGKIVSSIELRFYNITAGFVDESVLVPRRDILRSVQVRLPYICCYFRFSKNFIKIIRGSGSDC